MDTIKSLKTESGEDIFTIRLHRGEQVALLTTASNKHYLLLDSIDYWFDIIQSTYPRELKCKCKNKTFKAELHYFKRENNDDYKQIDLMTTCTNCGEQKIQVSFEIDYSPTEGLLDFPITPVSEPKLKYKLSEITSYWTTGDVIKFLAFIFSDLQAYVYCWYFKEDERKYERVDSDKIINIIKGDGFLNLFLSPERLSYVPEGAEKGVYVNRDLWRKAEIVSLSSPIKMVFQRDLKGDLYYLTFCNEFIRGDKIVPKSNQFAQFTNSIINWLKENYVSSRGKNCFDNALEHNRLFGKRFLNS